jgi:hypothetical protein
MHSFFNIRGGKCCPNRKKEIQTKGNIAMNENGLIREVLRGK